MLRKKGVVRGKRRVGTETRGQMEEREEEIPEREATAEFDSTPGVRGVRCKGLRVTAMAQTAMLWALQYLQS